MKIAIFNAKFSNNLGDGIIAEALEGVLSERASDVEIVTLDIGGREEFGTSGLLKSNWATRIAKTVFRLLPIKLALKISNRLTQRILLQDIAPIWEKEIKEADIVVIGGGQLIADALDYFPQRVRLICDLAKDLDVPYVVHGVGVSSADHFRSENIEIFKECFERSELFMGGTVRDDISLLNWTSLFSAKGISVVPDPAFVISDVYDDIKSKTPPGSSQAKPTIGIGLIASATIDDHTGAAEGSSVTIPDAAYFIELAQSILDRGIDVVFFTNGDDQDESLKRKLEVHDFGDKRERVSFQSKPENPRQLIETIASMDLVIAHRLHALITAHSFRIPTVPLMWHQKVQALAEAISREDYLVRGNPDPSTIARMVKNDVDSTISESHVKALKDEVVNSCDALLELAKNVADSDDPVEAAVANSSRSFSGSATRSASNGASRKVLLSSNYDVWREPFNSQSFGFLQVLSGLEDATILNAVRKPHLSGHAVRPSLSYLSHELAQRSWSQLKVATGRKGVSSAVKTRIDGIYDLMFFTCQFPIELSTLANMNDWRSKCGFVAVYLMETWSSSLASAEPYLRYLEQVDHIFVLNVQSIPELRKYTSTPITPLFPASDCLLHTPLPEEVPRIIDVFSFGRRAEKVHRDLVARNKAQNDFFYQFDSIQGGIVGNWEEHRLQCAKQIKRSKFFLAFNPGDVGGGGKGAFKHQQALSTRYFEGAAGGSVMLGTRPKMPEFDALFDWDDVLIELSPEGDVCALIDELERDPERLRKASKANALWSLRKHDWAHRWMDVLDTLGLPATAKLNDRIAWMAELADREPIY